MATSETGVCVRLAWATRRLSVSSSPRRLGRPVSESVDARRSASERLRRLASTGAAWVTESWMRCVCSSASGRSSVTSTEPMTSPPTSSGWHIDCPGTTPQTSQVRTSSVSGPWLTGRLRRTARHERGLACPSAGAIGSSSGSATADSSRSALLLRTRMRTAASGNPAPQVRAQQRVALLLVLGHLHALGEARLRPRVLGLAGGQRLICGATLAAVATGAPGEREAEEAEHAAQHEDRLHRDQRRSPQLLATVAIEQVLKPAIGGEEGVQCLVAGDGISARLVPPLGRELDCPHTKVFPHLLGALLRVDLAQ